VKLNSTLRCAALLIALASVSFAIPLQSKDSLGQGEVRVLRPDSRGTHLTFTAQKNDFVRIHLRSLGCLYTGRISSASNSFLLPFQNLEDYDYKWVSFVTAGKGSYDLELVSTSPCGVEVEILEISPGTSASQLRAQSYNRLSVANSHFNAGKQGSLKDLAAASTLFTRSADYFHSINDGEGEAWALNGQAAVLAYQGQSKKAVEVYRRAVALAEPFAIERSAPILFGLADTLTNTGDYEEAHKLLSTTVEVTHKSGDLHLSSNAIEDLAIVLIFTGKPSDSLPLHDEAMVEAKKTRDNLSVAVIEGDIGLSYQAMGDFVSALRYYEQAYNAKRSLSDRKEEAGTLQNICNIFSSRGELGKARDCFRRSLELSRLVGDVSGEALALSSMADALTAVGQFQEARRYYERAIPMQEAAGDEASLAATLENLGLIYFQTSDYPKALELYNRSLQINQKIGSPRGQAEVRVGIARAFVALGDHSQAMSFFKDALQNSRDAEDRSAEAEVLASLGLLYEEINDSVSALPLLDEASKLDTEAEDPYGRAYVLTAMGRAYSSVGDVDKAKNCFQEALQLALKLDNPLRQAIIYNAVGKSDLDRGRPDEAMVQFRTALWLTHQHGAKAEEATTLGNLMLAYQQKKNPGLAIFYGKQSVNILQALRVSLDSLDKRLRGSFIKSKEEVYRNLAENLVAQGRLPEAEAVIRMLKEEEFSNYTTRDANTSDKHQPVVENESELKNEKLYLEVSNKIAVISARKSALESKKNRTPAEDEELSKLGPELEAANTHFQNFLDALEDEFLSSGRGAEPVRAVREGQGLMEDLKSIGDNTVALYTLVGEDKLRLIIISPDIQIAREYPISREELMRRIISYRAVLQDPTLDDRTLGKQLYDVMIGPIASDLKTLGAKTLMWSLDGPLRYVPVSALFDGNAYLLESYKSVIFTPASEARFKDSVSATWTGVGFGVTQHIGDFAALPEVRTELQGIFNEAGSSTGVMRGKIYLDQTFTRNSLAVALRERKPPVVHIASHFQFNGGNDSTSFLLLGNGEHLTLRDIRNASQMFRGVDILTLSACNTAMGTSNSDGREVEGFAVIAQRQGAKAVIATLWHVEDRTTSDLMRNFYQTRMNSPNSSKLDALTTAQLSILHRKDYRGVGQQEHPFFWAPFELIGNWK
jgi:CHAT domain-containing protein/Tfp pilus assembly protein PilF